MQVCGVDGHLGPGGGSSRMAVLDFVEELLDPGWTGKGPETWLRVEQSEQGATGEAGRSRLAVSR